MFVKPQGGNPMAMGIDIKPPLATIIDSVAHGK